MPRIHPKLHPSVVRAPAAWGLLPLLAVAALAGCDEGEPTALPSSDSGPGDTGGMPDVDAGGGGEDSGVEDTGQHVDTGPAPVDTGGPVDPCDPNPCTTEPGLTECTVVGDGFECACNQYWEPDGEGGCDELREVVEGTVTDAVDWSEPEPTYLARLLVLDPDGGPIEGAQVVRDGLAWAANAEGRITLGDLPAKEAVRYEVRAGGFATSSMSVRFYEAGLGVQEIRLKPVDLEVSVDASEGAIIEEGAASVGFPPGAFRGAGGLPFEGVVQVHMTSVDPYRESVQLGPDLMGQAEQGNVMPITSGGMVYVEITDEAGTKVTLRPNEAASLTFVLPADLAVEDGETLDLRFFNRETGLWQQEGGCVAEPIPEEDRMDERSFRCTGAVRHFTWWNVDKPEDTACVNVSASLDLGVRYSVVQSHFQLDTCTATEVEVEGVAERRLDCAGAYLDTQASFWSGGRRHYPVVTIPPEGERPESICRLVSVEDQDLIYIVRAFFQIEDDAPAEGQAARAWYRYDTEELDLESIADRLGAPDLWAFTAQPSALCPFDTRCAQVALELELDSLTRIPLHDEDGDTFGVVEAGALPLKVARYYMNLPVDCDDSDPDIHPGAEDEPCDGIDSDCVPAIEIPPNADGSLPTWEDVPPTWLGRTAHLAWNRYWCATECVQPDAEETAGNFFDEDCDGRTLDADDDGFISEADAEALRPGLPDEGVGLSREEVAIARGYRGLDCDDQRAYINPDEDEIHHNRWDEDCDGEALDYDGDEYYDIRHRGYPDVPEVAEDEWDCDDFESAVHPHADPVLEQTFRRFYNEDEQGRWHRSIDFCHYVDTARGRLFDHAAWLLKDYDCDGFATDVDGDGYTRPGNTKLGAALAFDCDDLDFRVHPDAPAVGGVAPDCGPAYPIAQIVNDALCEFAEPTYQNPPDEDAVPQCPNTPDGLLTRCVQFGDGQGGLSDTWGCSFSNVRGSPPLRLPEDAGKLWGVCGSTLRLPPCGADTACGGPVQPSANYVADLNRIHIDPVRSCQEECDEDGDGGPIPDTCHEVCSPEYLGDDVTYGMCFPRCDRCTGVVCPDTGNVCTRAVCEGDTGACGVQNVNGRPCDDGNGCTLWDACTDGECRAGRNAPLGTQCSDGQGSCDGDGACVVGG